MKKESKFLQSLCHGNLALEDLLTQKSVVLLQGPVGPLFGKLARDGHFSFVFSGVDRLFAMTLQQPAFVTHHPVNPLVVDPAVPFQPQASPDAAVAVGGAVLDHIGNGLIDDSVIIARR